MSTVPMSVLGTIPNPMIKQAETKSLDVFSGAPKIEQVIKRFNERKVSSPGDFVTKEFIYLEFMDGKNRRDGRGTHVLIQTVDQIDASAKLEDNLRLFNEQLKGRAIVTLPTLSMLPSISKAIQRSPQFESSFAPLHLLRRHSVAQDWAMSDIAPETEGSAVMTVDFSKINHAEPHKTSLGQRAMGAAGRIRLVVWVPQIPMN